ncbi:MAG: hypothetical protein ICV61_10870, partial [Microcoleus sp. Co-bin12]|nr:hypothetical protein [Microcoleus sp. Co-bin12]
YYRSTSAQKIQRRRIGFQGRDARWTFNQTRQENCGGGQLQQQECDRDDTCHHFGQLVRGDRENHTIEELKNWE